MGIIIDWSKTFTTVIIAVFTAVGVGSFGFIVGIYIMVSDIKTSTAVKNNEQEHIKKDLTTTIKSVEVMDNSISVMDKDISTMKAEIIELKKQFYIKPEEIRIVNNKEKRRK